MRQLLNRFQPVRPWQIKELNRQLMYRTYPMMKDDGLIGQRVYRVTSLENRIAQMQLYRWCRGPNFVNFPACGDLYDFLFQNRDLPVVISKKTLGRTIFNSLSYNCKKLKGITKDNDKVRQLYCFESAEELQYGLEYMICAWLRKFLNDHSASESQITSPEEMEMELDLMASLPWAEFKSMYLKTQSDWTAVEPDWRLLLKKHNVDAEGDYSDEFDKEPESITLRNYR